MKTTPNDQLKTVLKDWATRQAPSADHMEQLTARIIRATHQEPAPARGTGRARILMLPVWGRFAYTALGAAAAVVITLGIFHLDSRNTSRGDGDVIVAEAGGLSEAAAQEKLTLFREMNAMFGQRVRGVVEAGNNVVIDVAGDRTAEQLNAVPIIVVQMKMMTRQTGSTKWTPVWSADIMTRGEELVEKSSDASDGNKMLVWAYPLEDGSIAVDSTLDMIAPLKVKWTGSSVLTPGKSVRVQSATTGSQEYQILQTARVLGGQGANA